MFPYDDGLLWVIIGTYLARHNEGKVSICSSCFYATSPRHVNLHIRDFCVGSMGVGGKPMRAITPP